jgi:hypothetical protein
MIGADHIHYLLASFVNNCSCCTSSMKLVGMLRRRRWSTNDLAISNPAWKYWSSALRKPPTFQQWKIPPLRKTSLRTTFVSHRWRCWKYSVRLTSASRRWARCKFACCIQMTNQPGTSIACWRIRAQIYAHYAPSRTVSCAPSTKRKSRSVLLTRIQQTCH